MKFLFYTFLLASSCIGCATRDSRPGVQAKGPHEYMFVSSSGRKAGFSALELEQISRRYGEEHKLPFSFESAETSIWIRTDGSPVIADVYFISGLGKPSLHVEIDRDGAVKRYKIVTVVCGTGIQ